MGKVWRWHLVHRCITLHVGDKEQTMCVTRVHFSECVSRMWRSLVSLSVHFQLRGDWGRYPVTVWGWLVWGRLRSAIDHIQTHMWRQKQDSTAVGLDVACQSTDSGNLMRVSALICFSVWVLSNDQPAVNEALTERPQSSYRESFKRFAKRYKSIHFKRQHP